MGKPVEKMPTTVTINPPAKQSVHPGLMISALMEKPDLDTDKLMNLFELQEKYDAKVAREAYYEAITRFRAIVDDVDYNRRANFGGRGAAYGYATLRHMLKVITPALEECGLTPTWTTGMTDDNRVLVTCFINHAMGHSESTSLPADPDTSGSKNSIQAVKSTVSYLRRITLESMLGIAADEKDDDDGQGATPAETITADDLKAVQKMIKDSGADLDKLLLAYGIDSLDMLPKNQLARLTDQLKRKAGAK